ncbi:MAG: hypothetical protein JXA73_13805 [Acidobacteria bacterium]|nr:hypothetical protein [Acidobacteriota bacterium]
MKFRREAVQTGVAARRATGGFRRRTCSEAAGLDQYVEEADRAQRGRHARIRSSSSRSFMNKAD